MTIKIVSNASVCVVRSKGAPAVCEWQLKNVFSVSDTSRIIRISINAFIRVRIQFMSLYSI